MKRLIVSILIWFSVSIAFGQHTPLYSQYMFNGLVINPAFAFGEDGLTAILDYKKQWVGKIEGAPSTLSGTIYSSSRKEKMGMGIIYQNDQIGIKNQHDLSGNFVYRIKTKYAQLGLGISGGLAVLKYNQSKIQINDENDPVFDNIGQNHYLPKIGWGLYYHNQAFFVGVAIPQWLIASSSSGTNSIGDRTLHINGGYNFNTKENLVLSPSTLVRLVNGSPLLIDFNLTATLNKTITAGVSYRMYNSLVLLAQYNWQRLSLGYAFDFSNQRISMYTHGSHEIMLKWHLGYAVDVPDPKRF
jgi:type IX secretion system PorP/SprF family membrane protein